LHWRPKDYSGMTVAEYKAIEDVHKARTEETEEEEEE
jgi:hypothetical protein